VAAFAYAGLQTKALALLEKFGRSVTLTKKGGATPSAAGSPWEGGSVASPTTATATAVFTAISKDLVDGDRIRLTDQGCYLAGSVTEPVPGDTITDGSTVYQVLAPVQTIKPGDTALLYQLVVRA
jgi:hypothetical protein